MPLDFVDRWGLLGWEVRQPTFLYRPLDVLEDDVEWRSGDIEALPAVKEILKRQQEQGLSAGIQLFDPLTGASAMFVFTPQKREIAIHWGPDCPRNSQFGRVVDPSWALETIALLFLHSKCCINVMQMEFCDPM